MLVRFIYFCMLMKDIVECRGRRCGLMVSMLGSRSLSGLGFTLARAIVKCSFARHFTLTVPG